MSALNDFETKLLQLLFNNTGIANIGDATGLPGSAGAGSSQLALHTVALGETTADMTVNEVAYTGYARPTQPRSGSGWTVSGSNVTNAALIQFGEMTAGGPDTVVHVSLGFLATGNVIRLEADLNLDLVINDGVNPQFAIGALVWTLD